MVAPPKAILLFARNNRPEGAGRPGSFGPNRSRRWPDGRRANVGGRFTRAARKRLWYRACVPGDRPREAACPPVPHPLRDEIHHLRHRSDARRGAGPIPIAIGPSASTQFAQESGNYDALYNQINDLHGSVQRKFTYDLRPINPGLSLLLTIVTFGFYAFYVFYRQDKFWWEIQEFERNFDDSVSQLWTKLGILKYPVKFEPRLSTKRSFGLCLGLSVVTFGIYAIIWDYKIHTDPPTLYPEFHAVEDAILNVVRTASPQVV